MLLKLFLVDLQKGNRENNMSKSDSAASHMGWIRQQIIFTVVSIHE